MRKSTPKATFKLSFKVRDYECDLQGIVNNSVYTNYLEHTRHEYLLSKGYSFDALHQAGEDLVLKSITIDFKASLKSQDHFTVTLSMTQKSPLKYQFIQNIYKEDGTWILSAECIVVSLKNGKPNRDSVLKHLI